MLKRRVPIGVSLVLLLLVIALPVAAAPQQTTEWTHVVNAWLGLRMRTGPSLGDSINLVLYNGENVRVKGDPIWVRGIRWSNVEVTRGAGEFEGWVASAYLANYPGYVEPADHFVGEGYKVTSSIGLRLRSAPGLNATVKRIVPYGTILEKVSSTDKYADGLWWKELTLDGETVWSATQFLEQVTVP